MEKSLEKLRQKLQQEQVKEFPVNLCDVMPAIINRNHEAVVFRAGGSPFKIDAGNLPPGDAVVIGADIYLVEHNVVMDLFSKCNVKGEGLTERCPERSAYLATLLNRTATWKNENGEPLNSFIFSEKNGRIIHIHKRRIQTPNVVAAAELIPRSKYYGRRINNWEYNGNIATVTVNLSNLTVAEEGIVPQIVVQDSMDASSSLTYVGRFSFSTGGSIEVARETFRHDGKFSNEMITDKINDLMEKINISLFYLGNFNCCKSDVSDKDLSKLIGKNNAKLLSDVLKQEQPQTKLESIKIICREIEKMTNDWEFLRKQTLSQNLAKLVWSN